MGIGPENNMPLRITLLSLILIPLVFVGLELSWRAVRIATPTEDTALSLRTIIDHQVFGDVVRYTYLGERLPETLVSEEVVGMRTETSYSRLVTLDDETATVETISYPRKTFAQDTFGNWFYAEYATTTRDTFLKQSALRTFVHVARSAVVEVAHGVTDTIFSNTTGDGQITGTGTGIEELSLSQCLAEAWADTRTQTTGTVSSGSTSMIAGGTISSPSSNCNATIYRVFVPFDTSTISSSATISSASLNIYVTGKVNGDNDGTDYITVVRTSQATHTALATTDFDNITTTEGVDAAQRKDITSISTSAYLVFTLNSTGLGWIAKNGVSSNCSATAGISCFGLREGHDNTATALADETTNTLTVSSTDTSGTSQDPYLSVTYTVPAEVFRHDVFWFD